MTKEDLHKLYQLLQEYETKHHLSIEVRQNIYNSCEQILNEIARELIG